MDNKRLIDIEATLEKTFIEEWICKLRIWAKIDNKKEYLYRKEVLQDILQTLEKYPEGNNISVYTSERSHIFEYEKGHVDSDEWEHVDIVSMGLYAIIKGNVDPFIYVLGKYLKIYKRNRPIDERKLEYTTDGLFKDFPVEDVDFEDMWILEPIAEKGRKYI